MTKNAVYINFYAGLRNTKLFVQTILEYTNNVNLSHMKNMITWTTGSIHYHEHVIILKWLNISVCKSAFI